MRRLSGGQRHQIDEWEWEWEWEAPFKSVACAMGNVRTWPWYPRNSWLLFGSTSPMISIAFAIKISPRYAYLLEKTADAASESPRTMARVRDLIPSQPSTAVCRAIVPSAKCKTASPGKKTSVMNDRAQFRISVTNPSHLPLPSHRPAFSVTAQYRPGSTSLARTESALGEHRLLTPSGTVC